MYNKKSMFLFVCLLLIFSVLLSSCGDGSRAVLTINENTQINSEIFTYFLNEAYYGSDGYTESECIDYATSECLKYIAVNTQFAKTGRKLSVDEKASISAETNALWQHYGDYLKEIGVSKDTFFKIKQYDVCREKLRFSLYDTNGTSPVNEDYIKQYFTSSYVGIKYFYCHLYSVKTEREISAMSPEEKQQYDATRKIAEDRYNFISSVANYVNSGVYSMNEAFMAVTGEVSADINVNADVVGKDSSSFSEEFKQAVFKQAVGSAFIITDAAKSYVYFIERVDLLSDEYNFYEQYRDDCLKAVSENYFIQEINSWVQSYNAVRHLSAAEKCLGKIKKTDRSKYVGGDGYKFKSFNLD